MSDHEPLLFAPCASRALAGSVARHLGLELSPLEERDFEDGEHKSRPLVNVRGRDVYVIQALHGDASGSVNDRLVRLLFLLQNLKDQGAARVTAVFPYLGYARKDRRTQPRDPVTSRYVAQLLEAMGTDRVLALDVHNPAAYQNAFRIPAEHLEARVLFAPHVALLLGAEDAAVVSPDAGGVKRAEDFRRTLSRLLGRPVETAFVEKHRALGEVWGEALVGGVEGRTAIVVDDLVATGTTLVRAARACRHAGARRVMAVATHGLFSAGAARALADAALDALFVTDSIAPPRELAGPAGTRLTRLSAAPLLAEAIRRLAGDGPLTDLLEPPPPLTA